MEVTGPFGIIYVHFDYHFSKLPFYAKCRTFTVNGAERENR